jgi:hypothetical protein
VNRGIKRERKLIPLGLCNVIAVRPSCREFRLVLVCCLYLVAGYCTGVLRLHSSQGSGSRAYGKLWLTNKR